MIATETSVSREVSKEPKVETSYRMCEGVINLPVHSRLRRNLIDLYREVVTKYGVAMQEVLEYVKNRLNVHYGDEKKIRCARLKVVASGKDVGRAQRLLEQPMTAFGYTNSYRIVSFVRLTPELPERAEVEFEIVAAKTVTTKRGERRVLSALPANFLAQIILGWCTFPSFEGLTLSNRAGVAQKAAEQIISYLQLLDTDPNTAFPSTGERSPEARKTAWLGVLDRLIGNTTGFEYKLARDIDPSIPVDDPKGDRRINVDPDWMNFREGPEVDRFPVSFAKNDIVVYRRYSNHAAKVQGKEHYPSHEGRLYAFIPVAQKLDSQFLWWMQHVTEFTPLPAFGTRPWPKKPNAIMVPLEYRGNLDLLKDPDRRVKWTILAEERDHKRQREGHKGNNLPHLGTRWLLKFATENEVVTKATTSILGIHFHNDDTKLLVVWALARNGDIVETGEFEQTTVLDYALVKKAYLEDMQRRYRWVGNRQFRKELKRRTEELAHRIVSLAAEKDARIVIEDIRYVQKTGQGPDLNSRHSLWNYADLSTKTEFFAKDREKIPTDRLSEFVLKFRCPHCGAIRKEGEKKEEATTWRDKDVLHCRKCATTTVQDRHYFARQVALAKK